jgi:opacity protein-like surface antigen
MKLKNAVLLAGLLFVSSQAKAQTKVGTHQLGLELGVANPISNTDLGNGDVETFGETGPAVGIDYLYQFHPNFSVGADFNNKFQGTENYSHPHGGAAVTSSVWTMLAIGRFDLLPESRIRPYAMAGAGFGGARRSVVYANPAFNSENTSMGPAFAMGAGADFDINGDWVVGGELRYTVVGTDENAVGTGHVSTFDFLAKVGYKFGSR